MDFLEPAYLPAADSFAFGVPDEHSVIEGIERIEPFLKGQGYLPLGGKLTLLNASIEDASRVLDLILRLASQQQQDDRAREQLRDQADKDRVALAHTQKRNETLEESNKRLAAAVKELEAKLLAQRHKAEEQERELKQKLQSTTVRLNGYLYGGRDAGKRGSNAASAGAVGSGPGNARRVAPAYDRFRDDPAEAAASIQKLEADMAYLRQQNLRLQRELAAAHKQVGGTQGGTSAAAGAGGSPHRDGRRIDQLQGHSSLEMQSVRNALPSDLRGSDVAIAVGAASPDNETVRLQRLVRDLQLNVETLKRANLELQRQLDKTSAERSELNKTLHSLRSKCANLEVERRNAEDRFHRAQRANAALLDPVAAEAQTTELRAKLLAAEREIHEANSRADGLKERLVVAETDVQANQRHVEMLKRAVRAMPKGQQGLEQLEKLVAEELQPLHAKLREVTAELAAARIELQHAEDQHVALVESEEPDCGAAPSEAPVLMPPAPSTADPDENQLPPVPAEGLSLSPVVPLPASPSSRFDGFATKLNATADSPPMLQPSPSHAFYNRTFSSTMPSPHSECMVEGASSTRTTAGELGACPCVLTTQNSEANLQSRPGGGGVTQPGNITSGAAANASSPYMRRSVSAGVGHRMGAQYTSAERQRARWQVNNPQPHHRFPSPIDIIMEQARSETAAADATISILHQGATGSPSQGSSP